MTDKNTDQKATVCQKTPTQTQSEGARILPDAPDFPQTRNYDDTMVEDLAKTHAQTLVKLDKALAHADKLAEHCENLITQLRMRGAKANDPCVVYAQQALAAYESDKQ